MSLPTSTHPFLLTGNDANQYKIANSLRFRSSNSAYLSRTPGSSSADPRTWTFSAWVKRGALGTTQALISAGSSGSSSPYETQCYIDTDNLLYFKWNGNGSPGDNWTSSMVFRDPGAWYHIVLKANISNATVANRLLLYVNGVQQTFTSNGVQNNSATTAWLNSSYPMTICKSAYASANYFDGYMAEINFIDGQALTPSYFGKNDSITNQWVPIRYTGTYGTNGFYLKFNDASGATATTIGKDSSGNGNNWTPSGISVTSGVTYDSMRDSPTSYDDGGNGRGNYCVMNPLLKVGTSSYAGGNLDVTVGGSNSVDQTLSSFAMPTSGKWYAEITCNTVAANYSAVGLAYVEDGIGIGQPPRYSYRSDGNKFQYATSSAYGSSWTSGSIIAVAVDMDNQKLFFGLVSGGTITWQNSGDPVAGTNAAYTSISRNTCYINLLNLVLTGTSGQTSFSANFGQRPFAYTPPSGYKALNSYNLAAPSLPLV